MLEKISTLVLDTLYEDNSYNLLHDKYILPLQNWYRGDELVGVEPHNVFPKENSVDIELVNYLRDTLDPVIKQITKHIADKYYTTPDKLYGGFFLQEVSQEVYTSKYALHDENGLLERDAFCSIIRIALATAGVEHRYYPYEVFLKRFSEFFALMALKGFSGGGRIMANAGSQLYKNNTTLINCVVLNQIPDSIEGIMDVAKSAALSLKSGAGVGYNFSTIRPRGAFVHGAGAETSGVISFMEIFDRTCSTIMSAGGRRGAQMATLHVDHPEIKDFITTKRSDGTLRYFNLSVLPTDKFMEAVENDEDYELWFWEKTEHTLENPGDIDTDEVVLISAGDIPYSHYYGRYFTFASDHVEVVYGNTEPSRIFRKKVYEVLPAKELYDLIMQSNYEFAEPGFIFIDRINDNNNLKPYGEFIQATNPCFSGDTKVMVADGRGAVDFKTLAKDGEDVPVYTEDSDGKLTIRMMRNPRITGHNEAVYKVTLDSGDTIRVTGNHEWPLRDGRVKETLQLKAGDSLNVLTKYEAKFHEMIPKRNSNSQKYNWLKYNDKAFNLEHRYIAAFYNNLNTDVVPVGMAVHHKDHNGLNNHPTNLEIMSHKEHTKLHRERMLGANNPMNRFPEKNWLIKQDHSGLNNGRSLGVTNEEIKEHAIKLTNSLGRKFGKSEWQDYARTNGLPVQLDNIEYRRQAFNGGYSALAKWAAKECGFENLNEDPRVLRTYEKFLNMGYNAKIFDGVVFLEKPCEGCGKLFEIDHNHREVSFCSVSCSNNKRSSDRKTIEKIQAKRRVTLESKKGELRVKQAKVYSDLKFSLEREPQKTEWVAACKSNGVSYEISRKSSPFRTYKELKEAGNNYNHKVVSVEFDGYETVYNGTVDDTHTLFAGNWKHVDSKSRTYFSAILLKQCGEQPLPPENSCNLGSLFLNSFVDEAFSPNAKFNFSEFSRAVRLANRFLDNVNDITNLPLEALRYEAYRKRRHGLGVTGVADMLAALGLKYGSEKGNEVLKEIMEALAVGSLWEGIDLARHKGLAPIFQEEGAAMFLESQYVNNLLDSMKDREESRNLRNQLLKGMRYSHATSIAPTGTMSLTWADNVANGVEPTFSHSYLRNIRVPGKLSKVQQRVYSLSLLWYLNYMGSQYEEGMDLPKHMVTTENIAVNEHISVQATLQPYVDSSISKTCNVPTDYSFEDFKNAYMKAWKLGLKGFTTFRFNPNFSVGVLTRDSDLKNTYYEFKVENDGGTEETVQFSGDEMVEYMGEVMNVANLYEALKEKLFGRM